MVATVISGCHSSKRAFEQSQAQQETVIWPEAYDPKNSEFFVHNYIDIEAEPDKVWQILIDARAWKDFYNGASEVTFKNSNTERLEPGTVFVWETMGFDFQSTIVEFEPYERLAWESYRKNMTGLHAWLIIPTDFGCRLITDESQNGSLAKAEKIFQPNKLTRLHDEWLKGIKARAEAM